MTMMRHHQQFKMAADNPEEIHIVLLAAMLNFTYISMKLQDSRYCIVTATPEKMVVAFEITFLPVQVKSYNYFRFHSRHLDLRT